MELDLNDPSITYARDQPGVVGPAEVLLDGADNLIEGTAWESEGYTVQPFLEPATWKNLYAGIVALVRELMLDGGADVPEEFRPDQYHRYTAGDESLHRRVVGTFSSGIPVERMPIDHGIIIDRVGQLVGKKLTMIQPGAGTQIFAMRAVRPCSKDNNPLHRDPWLSQLSDTVNLYVPIAGSNDRSSLAVVPGSHLWKESEVSRTPGGARIGSMTFSVPALVGATRPVHAIRPDPGENEVLVFSPYLLHGGASNLNADVTRISLEIRLWRAGA